MIFKKKQPWFSLGKNITEACAVIDDILDFFLSGDQEKRLWLLWSWVRGGGTLFL